MKKFFVAIFVLTLSLPSLAVAVAKLAVVDTQKVMVTINEGKKIKERLEKVYNKKKKELKDKEAKILKMQEDFKKQSMLMNDKKKMEKQTEIQKLYVELQQKTMEYQKEMQELEKELKTPIINKMKAVIEKVSKDEKVDFTVEDAAHTFFYIKEKINITDKVVQAYNKKHK